MIRPSIIGTVILLICATAAFAFVLTFFLIVMNTFFPRYLVSLTPKNFQLDYENVFFETEDGVKLTGWYIKSDPNRPTVIICHGLGAAKEDLLGIAVPLAMKNFNIFMFDFRGHGRSGGSYTSLGYLEQKDLEAAIDYLEESGYLKNDKLGVYGISMGGSVSIIVAARDKRLKAVVTDSAYVDLRDNIFRHAKLIFHLPRFPFGYFAVWAYQLRFMTSITNISPINVVSEISPRPIFIINGARDPRMLPEEAENLFKAAEEPKKLWIVPNAGHLEAHAAKGAAYEEEIALFFEHYLESQ